MSPAARFPNRLPNAAVKAIDRSKILGIRAGRDHRFIGVWSVVVDGRVFVRSWSLKPDGWFNAFCRDALGAIQIQQREISVRAVRVRSERIKAAVDRAYAEKYDTPGALKYVRDFHKPKRRDTTTEFVPARKVRVRRMEDA